MLRCLLLLCLAVSLPAQVVISQVYGGGGNTGATLRNDFIEIFNRGPQSQDLTGWQIEYAGATATAYVSTPLSGTLAPGQYFLIQQSAGAGGSQNLPTPDAAGTALMSATAGKVQLRAADGTIVDRLGYGATANEFEGAPTRELSNSTAALRARNGCQDTNNNSSDFTIAAPAPRNRTAPRIDCSAPVETLRLSISEIQGPGAESPYAGRRVVTSGIVTYRRTNGFYIQMPQPAGNASSGLLVFTQTAPPATAQVGALLEVEGDVVEFRPATDPQSPPLTELINPVVTVRAQNQTLPTPVALPLDQDLEPFEGMLVRTNLNIVSPTSGTTAWGTLDAPRPFRRTDEARWPNLLRVITTAALSSGITVPNLSGPLDYGSRTYTIYANPIEATTRPTPIPAPARQDYEFTVGTLNVQRLFADAALPARLNLLRDYVQRQMGLPDILIVPEVESLSILEQAADAIRTDYIAFAAPSNDPSGITTGILVRGSRVTVDAVFQLAKDEEYEPGQITHDRPPVLLRARVDGRPIAVMGVHMRSRLNLEDPRVRAKRAAQYRSLASELAQLPASLPVAVVGDWNAFAEEINLPGLRNLTETVTTNDNYSYVFDGQTQTLDHILVNEPLFSARSRVHFARGNADYPSAERLSDHDGVVAYFTNRTVPFTAAGVVGSASFQSGSLAPNLLFTIFGNGDFTPNEPPPSPALRVLLDGAPLEVRYAGRNQIVALTPANLNVSRPYATLAVERNGAVLHSVQVRLAPAAPEMPGSFRDPFLVPFGGFRPGTLAVLGLTGFGAGSTADALAVRICRLPAGSPSILDSSPGFLTIQFQVPANCRPGRQPVEVSVGSRTTQANLFVQIEP